MNPLLPTVRPTRDVLARLLDSPDLALTVQSLEPRALVRLVQDCGLEECGAIVSLGGVARFGWNWSKPLGRPITRFSFVKGGESRIERGGRSEVLAADKEMAFARATTAKFTDFVTRVQSGSRDNAEARPSASDVKAMVSLVSGETNA